MDGSLILFNILNPPVLFFFLGMLAVFFKSDLEIPQPLPKLFSLYLLMAIGFKGGYELAKSGIIDILAAVKKPPTICGQGSVFSLVIAFSIVA